MESLSLRLLTQNQVQGQPLLCVWNGHRVADEALVEGGREDAAALSERLPEFITSLSSSSCRGCGLRLLIVRVASALLEASPSLHPSSVFFPQNQLPPSWGGADHAFAVPSVEFSNFSPSKLPSPLQNCNNRGDERNRQAAHIRLPVGRGRSVTPKDQRRKIRTQIIMAKLTQEID